MIDENTEIGCQETVSSAPTEETVVPVYIPASTQTEETSTRDFGTQSGDQPMFSIQNIVNDPQGIHFYTGLENYQTFKFVLDTLGVAAYHLNYYDGILPNIESALATEIIKVCFTLCSFRNGIVPRYA
ncbi:hypothetical protein ACJMK2_035163 [Sinanodonta woodiana]|uniref:Uncharacterized protein n=1 Tax=Sinanodonta woodiana TaxID=1069815 RepID=A0ABD3WU22_SINWO